MPVIVVGGDTPNGRAILEEIAEPDREVRSFVSDESQASALKELGIKVAIGDVSDDSHIEGAATRCFTAVLITEAARDQRERSFAPTEARVLQGWASAVSAADVTRVIWIHDGEVPETKVRESAIVDPSDPEMVQKVIDLDEAQIIKS